MRQPVELIAYAPDNGVDWTGEHVTAFFDSIERRINFPFVPIVLEEGLSSERGIHFDIVKMDEGQAEENRGLAKLYIPLSMILLTESRFFWENASATSRVEAPGIVASRGCLADFRRRYGMTDQDFLEAIIMPDGFDPLSGENLNGLHVPSMYAQKRRVVVLGGGGTLMDDFGAVKSLSADRMAVNKIGCRFRGDIKYWVSLHPEYMSLWREARDAIGGNDDYVVWGHQPWPGYLHTEDWGGSSGLFAAKVGLELGYDEIVLCGVPMDTTAGHIYVEENVKDEYEVYRPAWTAHVGDLVPRVRSLSGWTRELVEKRRLGTTFLTPMAMLGYNVHDLQPM